VPDMSSSQRRRSRTWFREQPRRCCTNGVPFRPNNQNTLRRSHMCWYPRLRRRRQTTRRRPQYLPVDSKAIAALLATSSGSIKSNQIKSTTSYQITTKAKAPSVETWFLKSTPCRHAFFSLSLFLSRVFFFNLLFLKSCICVIQIVCHPTGCNLAALARRGPWGSALSM
jgi:hypothetical protein